MCCNWLIDRYHDENTAINQDKLNLVLFLTVNEISSPDHQSEFISSSAVLLSIPSAAVVSASQSNDLLNTFTQTPRKIKNKRFIGREDLKKVQLSLLPSQNSTSPLRCLSPPFPLLIVWKEGGGVSLKTNQPNLSGHSQSSNFVEHTTGCELDFSYVNFIWLFFVGSLIIICLTQQCKGKIL